jgi:dihydrofolate reductase
MTKQVSLIVAVSDNQGIGLNNKLPWAHISADMKWFKQHTEGQVVVMGSKTYESLPEAFRPLPKRTNVVLTRGRGYADAHLNLRDDPQNILHDLASIYPEQEVFIIGGENIYRQFMPLVDRILITRVHQVVEADAFLDIDAMMDGKYNKQTETIDADSGVTFQIWNRNS